MARWLVPVALAILAAHPSLAHGTSGGELAAIFRTHCVEPFPSVEEIAAAAHRAGLVEHPLKIEDVLGSNALSRVPEAELASVVGFDARAFWPPVAGPGASLIAAPTITAFSFERTAAGAGRVIVTACNVSATKADEGRAGLQAVADRVARALEDRFGTPFEREGQATHATDELIAGEMTWRPVDQRQASEGSLGVSASLRYVEIEPSVGHRESSFWLLAVELQEAHP
jgi:hypothetical protein